VLRRLERAEGAGYEHRNRHGCLKGTRVALLDEIEQWAGDPDGPPIFWLKGLVGTGKSTIAHTVAERCFANGQLGASFFCSHRLAHDGKAIFPTLAFQLAQKYTKVRSTLVDHLRSNLGVVFESLKNQAEKLIAEPLRSADVAPVIVIDALDECKSEELSSVIPSVLGNIVEGAPKVKFFVTSRSEPLIERGFGRLKHVVRASALHDTTQDLVSNDIRAFLQHELSGLADWEDMNDWPTSAQLDQLRDRADGLFAYAFATVKFLDHWNISERCDTITGDQHNTIYERTVEGVHGGLSLDSLCTSIFQVSFKKNTAKEDEIMRRVLDAALFAPQSPPPAIPGKVRQQTGEDVKIEVVMGILKSISSLLKLHENDERPVRPFHKLLSDCLMDQERCPKRFLIRRGCVNAGL
jgi:nucleoside-triphosphatase THEP1